MGLWSHLCVQEIVDHFDGRIGREAPTSFAHKVVLLVVVCLMMLVLALVVPAVAGMLAFVFPWHHHARCQESDVGSERHCSLDGVFNYTGLWKQFCGLSFGSLTRREEICQQGS